MEYMISENVRCYKQNNNLSIRGTSRKMKVNYKTINELVNKKVNTVRLETAYNISRFFNISIDDLLFKNIFTN